MDLALVGVMAASIEVAKLLLAAIPNVEAVSLLIALYSYTFSKRGLFATLVFVSVEPLIWGINTWVISYFIYWPLLSIVFILLGKLKVKNRFVIAAISVFMTVFFGVMSAFVDIGIFSGSYDDLMYRFAVYYGRGVAFYVIHVVSNALIFPLLFPYCQKKLALIAKNL